jgi:hypothetical protein
VMDVSDLLKEKGKDPGVCCKCGPVGHGMNQDDEPLQKQQWACSVVLCIPCVGKRQTRKESTDGDGGKRTRRPKKCN